MKNEEMRVEIAKAMGWTGIYFGEDERPNILSGDEWRGMKSGHSRSEDDFPLVIPDFTSDLNACAEFEKTITEADKGSYARHLCASMGVTYSNQNQYSLFDLIHASAAQRCEAFLRTKLLWRD